MVFLHSVKSVGRIDAYANDSIIKTRRASVSMLQIYCSNIYVFMIKNQLKLHNLIL